MKFEIRGAAYALVWINIIAFIIQFISQGFTSSFMLVSHDVFTRPWILLTSMFLHHDPYHLFFNMYALMLFGPLLEQRIGTRRFLILYFVSGILASFVSSFFYEFGLGASGAIMGILGMLIVLMPDLQLLLFFVVPMPLWIAGIAYAALDVLGILFPAGIGNIAHLVGMATGLGYGFFLRKEKTKFYRKFTSKKHLDKEDMEEYLRSGRI